MSQTIGIQVVGTEYVATSPLYMIWEGCLMAAMRCDHEAGWCHTTGHMAQLLNMEENGKEWGVTSVWQKVGSVGTIVQIRK